MFLTSMILLAASEVAVGSSKQEAQLSLG